ncbi:MAG: TonB-dependent receptor [Bacteroidetes bacterium]|nr:TonB-dependent receptor [Bacteroidota bacterium]
MKVVLLQSLLTISLATVCLANTSVGQGILDKKVSVSIRNESFRSALRKLSEQAGINFSYTRNTLPQNEKVTLSANDEPLAAVFRLLFQPYNIHFEAVGRQVVLKRGVEAGGGREVQEPAAPAVDLIKPITGTVIDQDGKPVADASVAVKGGSRGMKTNTDGGFRIDVSDDDVLVISAIGYSTVEVPVKGQTALSVVLKTTNKKLDEVVVVGYGTQKRRDLTGAISSVKLENSPMQNLPNVNLLDALKGSVAGLNIGAVTSAGGNPGFTIRGQNSFSASKTPLVVVDGVVFIGSINEINPMDIASVDILKDASSAAIYGSLAANGVILITTKRGRTDKPTIQLNVTDGLQTYTKRPKMRDPAGYIQLRKDRFLADNPGGIFDVNVSLAPYELDAYKANHTVDWFDEVTRLAPLQNYNLSVAGATPRSNYYLSGNYMNQEGIVVGDQFHKFSFLAKLETKITSWLKTGVNLEVISKNADGVAADLITGTIDGPYGYKYVHDRGASNPGFGAFTSQLERYPQGQTTTSSPLWNTQQYNEDRNQNYRSTSFARVDIPWLRGLSYTFNYSLNRWEGHSANFQNENFFINTMLLNELKDPTLHLVDANGTNQNQTRTDWYMNHLINYKVTVGEHSIDATLLSERQSQQNWNTNIGARDFSGSGTTVLGTHSLELGNPANYTINTDYNQLHQMASLARVNYGYRGRYLASFSIREDGYSGFAEGHKYGVFRAGAAAWTVSEEGFMKRYRFIDNLKLRVSYGENGNPSVGAYSTFPTINSSNTILLGGITQRVVSANNLANKNLNWEKTTALNLGMDFSVFRGVLSGSLNFYSSNTTNLLLTRAIPIFNGYSSVLDNIGKIHNKGIELELTSVNYSSRDFTWKTGLNYWINRNRVVSLYGLDANKDGIEDNDVANGLFIGKSLGANYTYVMDGIIQKTDAKYMSIYGGQPGDIKFKDLNGDGRIDATNDRAIVGYDRPNYTVTLSNTLDYKGFELYFLFNFIAGGGKDNYYVGNNPYPYLPNALYGGTAANWLDKPYWTPDNPSNSVTRTNYNNSAYNYQFPRSRQFVRLQDLVLSYSLQSRMLRRVRMESARVFVSGKNLLTFSNWEGLDPESGTTFASSGFPVFKIYTLGVNVSF